MKFVYLFALVLTAILVNSCSSEKLIEVDPHYHKWVAGYTSGMVDRNQSIQIQLNNEVDSLLVQKFGASSKESAEFLKDIVTFEPEVEGTFTWYDGRNLVFVPANDLQANTLYTATFDLSRVTTVDRGYEEFQFQFATRMLSIDLTELDLNTEERNVNTYYAEGNLTLSETVDTALLRKAITAKFNGKNLPIRLESYYSDKEYHLFVDDIERGEKEGEVQINIDGKVLNTVTQQFYKLRVPSLNEFSLASAEVIDEEEQSVVLSFSESIDSYQKLDGLIDIKGVTGETFSVYDNQVTVYLPQRIEGMHQLTINEGILSVMGGKFKNMQSRFLKFLGPKPLLRMTNPGTILPDSKGLIFPFESIMLKSATVRIVRIYENNVHHFLQVNDLDGHDELFRFGKTIVEKRINLKISKEEARNWKVNVLDLEKYIRPQQGAIYRVSIKFDKKDMYCDCQSTTNNEDNTESEEENEESEDAQENNWRYDWDNGYSTDDYSYDKNPCSYNYPYGKAISSNILASNIGIVFKTDAEKTAHVFLTNMLTAKPLANATVEYYDFNKQLLATGKSDDQGMLVTRMKQKPFLLIAKFGEQRGYLKLSNGLANSFSKFDVSGEEVSKGLKGFLYAERGVWRPGDSLFVNFILRDESNKLPNNYPVKFTVTNPLGQKVTEITNTNHLNRHYSFHFATESDAPTGEYYGSVVVGNRTFSKSFHVETIKPNRLKIQLKIADQEDSSSSLVAKWLHGSPAKFLKANIQLDLLPTVTKFKGYESYTFDSPSRNSSMYELPVFNGQLDKDGLASFTSGISENAACPGKMKAVYTTKVFEKGGDFSIDRQIESYSPFKRYVGINIPVKNEYESLITGKKHTFPLVVVNEKGKPVAENTPLNVRIYELKWLWWYEQDDNDLSHFVGKNATNNVMDTTILAKDGKANFKFGINKGRYGRFLILVTDENGQHQTGHIVHIDDAFGEQRHQQDNEFASMLQFTTDKEKYETGDKCTVRFPSVPNAKALITLESRTSILSKTWIDTKEGETSYSFEVTKEMTPNIYVHITLIQPHEQTVNKMPIRLYGVSSILVENPETRLYPVVASDDKWKPETTEKVTISEQNGKAMTYTIAIVDEGLLDLTHFKTPNPWNTFYAKEALGVRTWDMYDDVIGAYSGKLDKLLAVGGDGYEQDGSAAKANRFQAMVRHIGPFYLPAGSKKTHSFELPAYVGSVKVMVVAHDDYNFGSGEKVVEVKSPLMVLGSLPRVFAPGEEINFPVTVFAAEKWVKNVDVTVSSNNFLDFETKEKNVQFTEIGDDVVNFKLKVAEKFGVAKISIKARSGGETAHQEFEIDVRSPNPRVNESVVVALKPGESKTLDLNKNGYINSHELQFEISSIEPINMGGRMEQLIQYPHGCIEQTTSAVFPQLLAFQVSSTTDSQEKKMDENIKAALKKYQSFQTSSGGFAYWPGNDYADDWGSNYAGHFMILAEKNGYTLPDGLKESWLNFQINQAQNWENNASYIAHGYANQSNQLIQAYRLYTLALAGKPELGAMNKLQGISNLSNVVKWRLAAAFELAGQHNVALQISKRAVLKAESYRELSYTYGSGLRDEAIMQESYALINDGKTSTLYTKIREALASNRWLSTQETAYGLLALLAVNSSDTELSVKVDLGKNAHTISGNKTFITKEFKELSFASTDEVTITNTSKKIVYVVQHLSKVPKIGLEQESANALNMDVYYENEDGVRINPESINQATTFTMFVTIENPTKNQLYKEMALEQNLPSGWEIINTRYMEGETSESSIDYQDIRDDRVYTYFDLAPKQKKTFEVEINASYGGKFYLPAVYCEAMYSRTIHAQTKGRWVTVK